MEHEPYADDIPEERPLSEAERTLVRWMLEHGESHAPEFLAQLSRRASVVGAVAVALASTFRWLVAIHPSTR
jgi:hypothetical protein